MAPQPLVVDDLALRKSLTSIRTLVTSFQTALESSPETVAHNPQVDLDPFPVLADASKLLKAQITKLSLLVINKPFSPKEVSFILNILTTSVLPALMSGLELCHPRIYPQALYGHVRMSLRIIWRELGSFLSHIPEDEARARHVDDKATLASTGLVWGHCDALAEVGQGGLLKFVDGKVKGYGDLFEDAIAEMEEWDPDDDDDDESESEDDKKGGKAGIIRTPTTSDEEALGQGVARLSLNPQYELKSKVMKRLRLIKLLYPAIRKRRISTFPVDKQSFDSENTFRQVQKMDALIQYMHQFTDLADELAAALYDNMADNLALKLRELSDEALQCVSLAELDWSKTDDEFSVWFGKWKDRFENLCGTNHDGP